MVIAALEFAIQHARGNDPVVRGYSAGLSAYDVWMSAMQQPLTEPFYVTMNAKVVAEARKHAAAFMRRLREREDELELDLNTRSLLEHLYQIYKTLSCLWDDIVRLLSLEQNDSCLPDKKSVDAHPLLQKAKVLETKAVETAASFLHAIKSEPGKM